MKLLLFLLILCCAHGAQAARTLFQVRCEDTMSRAVTVMSTQNNGYSIDNSKSYRALTTFKGQAPDNAYVLGLTRTQAHVETMLRCHVYPTLGDHPNKGCEHLRSLGYPEWVMRAIL